MTASALSSYYDSLDAVSKQRYDAKISLISGTDPYVLEKAKWTKDIQKFASVTYPDIVNFLLFSTSAYTLEELRSYKGLDAYNQFISGWVRDVSVYLVNGLCVHAARVMHSQRLNETSLSPWAIIQPDGKVLGAHCNCMAGLGEACTHIAAMLFSIDASVKIRESQTVTQEKAYWLPASLKGVTYSTIQDIDFMSAKSKKKTLDQHLDGIDVPIPEQVEGSSVQPPTARELECFLEQLSQTGCQSAILSVKKPFNKEFVPKLLTDKFPKLLTDLVNVDLLHSNYADIVGFCKSIKITVSKEEAKNVEKATVQQCKSKLWNKFRSGRITASRMYSACHSNPLSPSLSLVRAVCNPDLAAFRSKATSWGCDHEKVAREKYKLSVEKAHENFVIQDSGFWINPEYPLFGASPDGLVSCDCCGLGLLEIKCPFCVRYSSLDEYTGKSSCLEQSSDGKKLKENHPYFYQVQTQLYICERDYCDFVIWTESDIHIERVEPTLVLWTEISNKAQVFHEMAVMPELVARFYSRENSPAPMKIKDFVETSNELNKGPVVQLFCICQQPETPECTMVACDNQNCRYQWFHLSCLKLTKSKLPKGKWYCPDCLKLPAFRPKKGTCVKKSRQPSSPKKPK